jgi:hypothetical protein
VRLLDRSATVLLLRERCSPSLAGPAAAVPAPPSLSATLSAPASPVGTAVAVSGAVAPPVPGQVVTLQRYRAGRGTASPGRR